MIIRPLTIALPILLAGSAASWAETSAPVGDDVIAAQNAALLAATEGKGYGPQSPRDITAVEGSNARVFQPAPPAAEMNLCNIHLHEGAEHRGGEFTTYAGNGDGAGYGSGYLYDGTLTEAELAPIDQPVGRVGHGDLTPGDTVEVHYVFTTAQVAPGPTLGACMNEAIANPQLRVEAQVMVLVNDTAAADFTELTQISEVEGRHQPVNLPTDTGEPVEYAGSTTGPGYNEAGSPLQVSWAVRPEVIKVNIASLDAWLKDNVFDEDHAHGVRNLVVEEALLSPIGD